MEWRTEWFGSRWKLETNIPGRDKDEEVVLDMSSVFSNTLVSSRGRTGFVLANEGGILYEAEKGQLSCELMRSALIFLLCALAAGLTGCISFKKKHSDVYIDPVVRVETELDQFFGELDKEAKTMRYGQKSILLIK